MRVVVPEKEREVLEEITRKLDKLENDTLPQVDLSAREFIFTDVKFQVSLSAGTAGVSMGSCAGSDVSRVCMCVCRCRSSDG